MSRYLRLALAAGAALSLQACTTFRDIHRATQAVNTNADTADSLIKQRQAERPKPESSVTVVTDGLWVDTTAVRRTAIAPAALQCKVAYSTPSGPVAFSDVADYIASRCNVPVRLTPDALRQLAGGFQDATSGATEGSASPVVPAPTSTPPLDGMSPQVSSATTSTSSRTIRANNNRVSMTYSGQLPGMLDVATGQLGLSWRFDDKAHAVVVSYLQTQIFSIQSIPTTADITSSVTTSSSADGGGSTGSSGSSGGGSSGTGTNLGGQTQSQTQLGLTSDLLKDLNGALKSMLTPGIGRMSISAATGLVTVTDTPDVVHRIGDYIDTENNDLNRQVTLNVKVLAVDTSRMASGGFNLTALDNMLAHNYAINIGSSYQAPSGSTTASYSILEGNQRWSGSQAVISALNTLGNVSTVYEAPITTLNLTPTPVLDSHTKGFIARHALSQTAQVGTLQSDEPGSVTYGFSMSMLPYIQQDNKTVLLQFLLNLSTLDGLTKQGDTGISTPDTSRSIFATKARMLSGQTLLMTGYASSQDTVNKQGTGDPNNIVLGGGVKAEKSRKFIVVLVTPVVLK